MSLTKVDEIQPPNNTLTEKPKVHVKTFGCQMNEYDSSKMVDVLRETQNYESVATPEEADLILFNTCSVRDKAEHKLFSDLGRIRELKKKKPNLLLGVGGCVASQEGEAILKRAPFVDVVFGPQTLHRLPQLLNERQQTGVSQVDIQFPEIEKFDHLPPPQKEGVSAFVSIMEGCSKYCSFCVVPYTRGEEVSRPLDDVLTEIAQLAMQGVKEITLLGQNVNAYRAVLEREDSNDPTAEQVDFAFLLHCVADIPGVERIRYTTSHPKEFSDRLIQAYADIPKLVSHVHLPVQAGSDRILAAMKRGYTTIEYKQIIRKLRKIRPDVLISSDFIVGFPGETDQDFEQTMKLIEDVDFDASFSFVYSPRPGTPAANLTDDTPAEEKLRRLQRLQAKIDLNANTNNQNMVGTTQSVLIEGYSAKSQHELFGRTEHNRIVNFPIPTETKPEHLNRLIGSMQKITITAANSHTLRGELVLI
jgi:tRNA-2-methylthio-N6-dimethylallyladenosine synthase